MVETESSTEGEGSSPVGRGGAGVYIEGELGAFYLLSMLAGGEARGLPASRLMKVQFQAVDEGFALDDIVLHGSSDGGQTLLEIQSKRTITFAPKDPVFKDVCDQIARSASSASVPEEKHGLAVATQRTSHRISGPYQDVLEWARTTSSARIFFDRLATKGVASPEMRGFVETFRSNLVAHGVADDDDLIWRFLRRFQILEFDFESGAPLARTYALTLAQAVLAPADTGRAVGLWNNLIALSIAKGKAGGSFDAASLRQVLADEGFRLAGERVFAASREKVAEMARHALADISTTIAGAHLSRLEVVEALDDARDQHRFIELRGNPGVGKSAFLKLAAERVQSQAHALVLDPIGTPEGGWSALALRLGVDGTASAFFSDLAVSGGGVLFIDGLEMFASEERRRTVNDVLREVARIDGFAVVVTARETFGADGDDWLAADALAALGPVKRVEVGELTDADVEVLSAHAPELRHILAAGHPASAIARNPYRLTRLLKAPATAPIRTEAALARHWWETGSESRTAVIRPAQRMLANLADAALSGKTVLHRDEDSLARSTLLASLTLREVKRDHLAFYHDVLRDWAVGQRLFEDPDLLNAIDLSCPLSPTLARGVEFAGRFHLEGGAGQAWEDFLDRLSTAGAHGSWRRHALLAILRSEVSLELLERESDRLLGGGGALLRELCAAIVAVDTVPTIDLLVALGADVNKLPKAPSTLRTSTGPSGARLLRWCVDHASQIPLHVIPAVLNLVAVQGFLTLGLPAAAGPVAQMLFGWLLQLDVRKAHSGIPIDAGETFSRETSTRMVEELRSLSLLMAAAAPDKTKAYLAAIAGERDTYKVKAVRPMSGVLAKVAPEELANLVETGLIKPPAKTRSFREERRDPFTHGDSDFMPPSPAQPPFLDLLETSPEVGLGLVRRLTSYVIAFDAGSTRADDGFTLIFETGPRFFSRRDSYSWSRDQAEQYSVGSALKALEAWGHDRLDAGDPPEDVIADVLGPDGGCAAYLLVAVDLIISHWPATRTAAVPFMTSPALLAEDRGRMAEGASGRGMFGFQSEPAGRVQLKDLNAKPSRGRVLESYLPAFREADAESECVRRHLTAAVATLEPYEEWSNFGDARFMGVHALNLVTPANWTATPTGPQFVWPAREAEHFARLQAKNEPWIHAVAIEAQIDMATTDSSKGSATLAAEAVRHADSALPDGSDTDVLKTRSTHLVKTAMLAARDGDDSLLVTHEAWIRSVIDWALGEVRDEIGGSRQRLEFSRSGLATSALIHLWRRLGGVADRDRLVSIAVRKDGAGTVGFEAAMPELATADPRLAKSVLRAAFATSRWRWNSYDEDPALAEAFADEDAAHRLRVAEAEIAWLEDGVEPDWPIFPEKPLAIRGGIRIPMLETEPEAPVEESAEEETLEEADPVHVNTDACAQWLGIMVDAKQPAIEAWLPEVISAYARWTAQSNGLGLASQVEIERSPMRWNGVFYGLAASVILKGDDTAFDDFLNDVESLPDRSFAEVVSILLHSADVWYFNTVSHACDRPVALRRRLAERTRATAMWKRPLQPGSLSLDRDSGPLVATLLMNSHNPFTQTESYLVAPVFDRIDPLLEPLRGLMTGGPTPFIALCVMNTLSVQPRARHAEFLVFAVESWLSRLPADTAMWLALGIGRKVVDWFRAAAADAPELHGAGYPLRARIDGILGRLVTIGVAEAHELETAVEAVRNARAAR